LFFGELREEGLALIDETDAEKLSNRCFKLAEIFMRQRQRRINQLASTGTTLNDERRPPVPEPRAPLPPRPKPEIPIEQRLPDDPAKLSKEETEALIEEAQEVAEQKAEAATAEPAGEPPVAAPDTAEAPPAEETAAEPAPPPASESTENAS
jgi:hypothetical protein